MQSQNEFEVLQEARSRLERASIVDLIIRKDSPYRKAELERRQRIDLEDFSLWIVSKENLLILSKLVWAKPSGSELQLRDVRNLIAFGAEVEYLQQWAKTLSVQSQLEACLES